MRPCHAPRGSAAAAGLLLLSHEAGSQGNALLIYEWASNSLEVRFGVPDPSAAGAGLHLPAPAAASSPRKQGSDGTETGQREGGGSIAAAAVAVAAELAAGAQLAELAEPLPAAAGVGAALAVEAAAADAAPREHLRLVGGPLSAPAADEAGRVRLRVLIDGSALEVFIGSGEVGAGLCGTLRGGCRTEHCLDDWQVSCIVFCHSAWHGVA